MKHNKEAIQKSPQEDTQKEPQKATKETIKRRSAYFIFWAWHLIYTILVVALVLPEVAWPLMKDVMANNVPWHYLVYAFVMTLLPFVSIFLGAKYFRRNFRNLMKYFYGFEMPILFFLIIRMMTFRDSNLSMTWLLINVVIALVAWFIFLWVENNQSKKTGVAVALQDNPVAIAGSTVLAMVGLYFGTLFLIMMIPLAVEFVLGLFQAIIHIDLKTILQIFINPLVWLAIVFVVFTMSLFIALPVVMIRLYIGQFIVRIPSLLTPARLAIVAAVIGINLVVFSYLNQQPQQAVFTLLDEKMGQTSEVELLNEADRIKEGLLNAYLARYRYVSTEGLSQRIKSSYQYTFKMNGRIASFPQSIFNTLAQPFLYDGEDWGEVDKAQKYYEAFFDAPIQKAERDTILAAVKRNWEVSTDNEAGLLDAANHIVHLNQQSIQLKENQGVATISITQTLENLTYQQKETVMHFSLPEDAVLTGLWLSDDNDNLKKYPFVLAPKGAAQAVYKAEVNRRVDPALLEQTGSYQYRLRVYPIPRKEETDKPAKPMRMQFEYQTLIDTKGGEKGVWPLPKVLEKRNVFWDSKTEHFINGKKVEITNTAELFPINQMPSPSEESFLAPLSYKNIVAIPRQVSKEKLPSKGKFAILIDGSYSMSQYRDEVFNEVAALNTGNTSKATYSVYFCRQTCSQNQDKQVFFGSSQTVDHLSVFSKTAKANDYDAIIVLTDEGSYELKAESETDSINLTTPVWLVHLGDSLPYAYDDKVLDLIYQSKGGVARSFKEALISYQYSGEMKEYVAGGSSQILSVSDDRIWIKKNDAEGSNKTNHNSALEKIITAQRIKHLIKTRDVKKLDNLDAIHALAKTQGIVTHYSSMLVLINDRQREALKKAEEDAGRFEREIEAGKQNTSHPIDPFAVPSVPEPEEWALMIIAGILLSAAMWRRRSCLRAGRT